MAGEYTKYSQSDFQLTLNRIGDYVKRGHAVFFFGAGASRETGLYTAWLLVDQVIQQLACACTDKIAKEVLQLREDIIARRVLVDWPRLEKTMQLLISNMSHKGLELLDVYGLGEPGQAHLLVLQLAASFLCCDFFTTNFDDCIQKAAKHYRDIKVETIICKPDFEAASYGSGSLRNFMLHGTLPKYTDPSSREEIVATMDAILRALPDYKWRRLEERTRDRAVIFVGYTASDVDLRPRIAALHPAEIFWVDQYDMPVNARGLLGDRWLTNFIRTGATCFSRELRQILKLPSPRVPESESYVTEQGVNAFVRCWAESLNVSDVEFFFADLCTLSGEFRRCHTILDCMTMKGGSDDQSMRASLKRAELFLRESRLEELKHLLDGIKIADTGVAPHFLIEMARYFHLSGKAQKAAELVDMARLQARNMVEEAQALHAIGRLNIRGACDEAGVECLNRSASLFGEIGRMEERVTVLNDLAVIYQRRGNLDKAEEILSEVLRSSREIGDVYWQARAENNIGEVCRFRGQLSSAREHYFEAKRLAALINATDVAMVILNNIGLTYRSEKDLASAKLYFQQSIDSYSSCNALTEDVGNAFLNMGIVLMEEGNPAQGLTHFERASTIFNATNNPARVVLTDIYRGHALLAIGDLCGTETVLEQLRKYDSENPILTLQIDYLSVRVHLEQANRFLSCVSDTLNRLGADDDQDRIASVKSRLGAILEDFPVI